MFLKEEKIYLIKFMVNANCLGNIFVSNDMTAKQHVITSMKSDFNKKTETSNTPAPNDSTISMEELIEFAEDHGMVESRDAVSLLNESGVALSR